MTLTDPQWIERMREVVETPPGSHRTQTFMTLLKDMDQGSVARVEAAVCCVLMGTDKSLERALFRSGLLKRAALSQDTGHGFSRWCVAAAVHQRGVLLAASWFTSWKNSPRLGWEHPDSVRHHEAVQALLEEVVGVDICAQWAERVQQPDDRLAELAAAWDVREMMDDAGRIWMRMLFDGAKSSVLDAVWAEVERCGTINVMLDLADVARNPDEFARGFAHINNTDLVGDAFMLLSKMRPTDVPTATRLLQHLPDDVLVREDWVRDRCAATWVRLMLRALEPACANPNAPTPDLAAAVGAWRPAFGVNILTSGSDNWHNITEMFPAARDTSCLEQMMAVARSMHLTAEIGSSADGGADAKSFRM